MVQGDLNATVDVWEGKERRKRMKGCVEDVKEVGGGRREHCWIVG